MRSVRQNISKNLIVSSAAFDGENDALEVIPVTSVHQEIPEATRHQIRGIVESATAKSTEDEIIRIVCGRYFQDVTDPVIEGILQLFKSNRLLAIRIDIRRGASQHIRLERLCQGDGEYIIGFEHSYAGRIDDSVSAQFSSRFLIVFVVISNQVRERQSAVQIAAPAETFLLCHRSTCDTATR